MALIDDLNKRLKEQNEAKENRNKQYEIDYANVLARINKMPSGMRQEAKNKAYPLLERNRDADLASIESNIADITSQIEQENTRVQEEKAAKTQAVRDQLAQKGSAATVNDYINAGLTANDAVAQGQLDAMSKETQLAERLAQIAEDQYKKANEFYNYGNQARQQYETAINNYQNNMNNAVAKNNAFQQQATEQLQRSAGQLQSEMEAAKIDAYGTSTQDYFNRISSAGNQLGNQVGMAAGNLANNAAQDAARQAGLSKSAAAMMGAGQGSQAAAQNYWGGYNTGASQYTGAANDRYGAGSTQAQSNYTAGQNTATGLANQGQQVVAGAQNQDYSGQYKNLMDTNYSQGQGLMQSATGHDGGRVTHNDIISNPSKLTKTRYKPNHKIISLSQAQRFWDGGRVHDTKQQMQWEGQDTGGEWTKHIKYDSDTGDLIVTFNNGHVETYSNVDPDKADRIITGTQMKTGPRSDSVGAAIHQELLGH